MDNATPKQAKANQCKLRHREATHASDSNVHGSYATMGRASRRPETQENKHPHAPEGKDTQRSWTLPNARLSRTFTHSPGSASRFARISAWKIRFLRNFFISAAFSLLPSHSLR